MTPRSLAAVLLKCMGIFLAISALRALGVVVQLSGPYYPPSEGFDPRGWILFQVAHAMLLLAVGILFLVHTDLVLRLLFRDLGEKSDEPVVPATTFSWFAMALALLGAWVLSSALPSLLSKLLAMLVELRAEEQAYFQDWWTKNWSALVYQAIAAAFGLALFFASRRIAALWFAAQPIRAKGERDAGPPA